MPKHVVVLGLCFLSWAATVMVLVAEVMRAAQEATGIRARQLAFARGVLNTYDAQFVVWSVSCSPPTLDLTRRVVPTSCRAPTCRTSRLHVRTLGTGRTVQADRA